MQVVTKITTAKVFGKITKTMLAEMEKADADAVKDGKQPTIVPLYRMTGYVTDTKDGQGDNGPWVALKGDFSATRFDTGEVFMASSAFIPGATNDVIAGLIKSGQGKVIEFGCDVGIRLANTATGYEYVVRQLIEVDTSSSPSQKLMANLAGRFALPAPCKTPALAVPPAPVSEPAPEPAPVPAEPEPPQNS